MILYSAVYSFTHLLHMSILLYCGWYLVPFRYSESALYQIDR